MNFSQLIQLLVITKQFEVTTFEINFKSFHPKNSSLHLQQKWGVILLVLL
jgi:hypothetical protein